MGGVDHFTLSKEAEPADKQDHMRDRDVRQLATACDIESPDFRTTRLELRLNPHNCEYRLQSRETAYMLLPEHIPISLDRYVPILFCTFL